MKPCEHLVRKEPAWRHRDNASLQYPNNHIPFFGAVTRLADQENAISIGNQEFSKGFYKILDEDGISFSLACSQNVWLAIGH